MALWFVFFLSLSNSGGHTNAKAGKQKRDGATKLTTSGRSALVFVCFSCAASSLFSSKVSPHCVVFHAFVVFVIL